MSNDQMVLTSLLGDWTDGLIFVLSAPAGTGKTTLVQMLAKEFPTVIASISYTTRQPRSGEISGKDYFFIDESEFKVKITDGDFLEYVKLYDTYYGTSRQWVTDQQKQGKHVFLVIDTQGALKLKEERLPATFIFVRPPSIDVLRDRLSGRQTEPPEVVEQRLEWARIELEAAKNYDYLIVNDELARAYQVLKSIVIAECHRVRCNH